jgi:hypothetical protein
MLSHLFIFIFNFPEMQVKRLFDVAFTKAKTWTFARRGKEKKGAKKKKRKEKKR